MAVSTPVPDDRPYWYWAKLMRVVDGDTLWLDVDLGFHVHREIDVRLVGINAPEAKTPEGLAATEFLAGLVKPGDPILAHTTKDRTDRYARVLAALWLPDIPASVSQQMLDAGHAVPFTPA